ncbi:MAG TPA: transglycosylase SLT domain-containing protein [Chloroflexota bacterium]|nr:transglycosylase SLT domain-containing protein [Chloroflexota bacterium]
MHRVKTRSRSSSRAKAPSVKATIAAAAAKYHVPFWILWGVKVSETGATGTGIGAVSSTGAQGPFQFEPGTAQEYGVNVGSVKSSAEGAARLLRSLKKSTGSWEGALQGYSGGGYGVAHVKEKAAEGGGVTPSNSAAKQRDVVSIGPQNLLEPIPGLTPGIEALQEAVPGVPSPESLAGGAAKGVAEALLPKEVVEAAQSVGAGFKLLTDVHTWIRLGEGIGGVILLYIALKSLTGTGATDIPGGSAVADATKAAAFKRLPPAQRVKPSAPKGPKHAAAAKGAGRSFKRSTVASGYTVGSA